MPWDWSGLNETQILFILALGSPTHPIPAETYQEWASHCRWGNFYSQEHIGFAPLFGHQYTQVWLDLRGIQDSTMRAHRIDWFENSARATLSQRAYAISNPSKWDGYGERLWGLTACDGPMDTTLYAAGRTRQFHTYEARGASFMHIEDDGTVAPTAVGGSVAFLPETTITALMAMRADYGADLFGKYGFIDALNPTLSMHLRTPAGRVVPGVGWFDTDYLGIDQGPILAMAENLRTGLVWRYMRKNPHVIRGLQRGGFQGGWLAAATGAVTPVPMKPPTSTKAPARPPAGSKPSSSSKAPR